MTSHVAVPGVPATHRGLKVDQTMKMTLLRLFLRVLCVGFLAAFIPWITLIVIKAPVLADGSTFGPLLRFRPYNAPYEMMMTSIYVVWAIMMWRASNDPAKHVLFIDFTIWANAAHGLVMLIVTPVQKGLIMTVVEAIPLLVISAVLLWLRPRPAGSTAPESAPAVSAPY